MLDPISLTLAGAQAATGIVSAIGGFNSQNKQAREANLAARARYKHQLKIHAQENEIAQEIYRTKLDFYNQTLEANSAATSAAYGREQERLNDIYRSQSFQTQNQMIQLARGAGKLSAKGGAQGKSTQRADLDVVRQFGRNQATMAQNLLGAQTSYNYNVNDIQRQQTNSNNKAFSQVAVAPRNTIAPIEPMQQNGPSKLALAGNVASSVLSIPSTYGSMVPGSGSGGTGGPGQLFKDLGLTS